MKKFLLIFTAIILGGTVLTACGKENLKSEGASTEDVSVAESTAEITTQAESPAPKIAKNPLTGEENFNENAVGKRPVAVMVNNNSQSLPQYGIASAEIIYEMPVEGGITRLMAVYSDYTKIPDVCSIRSCRYYFPQIANGMDAIYLHWGLDKSIAADTLERLKITHFDGGLVGKPLFERDAERQKSYAPEHTAVLRGSKLPDFLAANKVRVDLAENAPKSAFNFNDLGAEILPQGVSCNTAILRFSKTYFSTFSYDTATGLYAKQHSGKPHTDGVSGKQLAFKNVVVLKTTTSIRNEKSGLLNVDLVGGKGSYISGGFAEEITWEKADDSSPIVLKKADGTPLSINSGKTFVGIIDEKKAVEIQ
ncbi:MAG: DUF3048 domain-containing protein [Oscillospiraceae bacterium]